MKATATATAFLMLFGSVAESCKEEQGCCRRLYSELPLKRIPAGSEMGRRRRSHRPLEPKGTQKARSKSSNFLRAGRVGNWDGQARRAPIQRKRL